MRRLILLLLLIGALVAGGVAWRVWFGAGPLREPASVVIPEGATLASAARALRQAGAIRSVSGFRRFAQLLGAHDPVRAGEFEIPAGASARAILDLLQHGKPVLRLVTIPEGMPSVLVRDKLAAAPALTGAATVPPEGGVLPDSYSYERGEPRAVVLARMRRAMDRLVAQEWAHRDPGLVVHSPREAVTLASIVEKETGVPAERATIAAVYSNRLRAGMRLQADPTVIYPVTRGRPLGRRILQSELHARNGYNTYAMAGLPEGPICNPGKASIAAVLHPAPTPTLYFVADGKGGHVFATTLAEHNANVAKWFAIRRARGEM